MSDDRVLSEAEALAEGARLFSLLSAVSPAIKAIPGVAAKASAVTMSKRRLVVTLKKDVEAVKDQVRAVVAEHGRVDIDFVVADSVAESSVASPSRYSKRSLRGRRRIEKLSCRNRRSAGLCATC
jgi:hypothetical protein